MFKDKIKELRKVNHLTQEQLAEKIGVSRSAVGMWERGDREPNFETAEVIADYFNVRLDELIGQKTIETYFEALRKEELKKAIFGKLVPDEMLQEVLEYAKYVMTRNFDEL